MATTEIGQILVAAHRATPRHPEARGTHQRPVYGHPLVVVLLDAGSRVPADGRLVLTRGVSAEESALTGESAAVEKGTDPVDADAPLADRSNRLHMNTTVSRGRAELVVTETGMDTEVGRSAAQLREDGDEKTPLQEQLSRVTTVLASVAIVACVVVFVLGLVQGADDLAETALAAVALAVAAIPEGLPAIVTVTLAVEEIRKAVVRSAARLTGAVDQQLVVEPWWQSG